MGLGLAKRPGRDNRGAECGSLAPSSGYVVGGQGSQQPLRFNIFESPSPSASAFVSVWICVSLSASQSVCLLCALLSLFPSESVCLCFSEALFLLHLSIFFSLSHSSRSPLPQPLFPELAASLISPQL